jgi:hypothetical protein
MFLNTKKDKQLIKKGVHEHEKDVATRSNITPDTIKQVAR